MYIQYIYVYIYSTFTYIYTHVCTYERRSIYTSIHMYNYVHQYINVVTYWCMCVCMSAVATSLSPVILVRRKAQH